MYSNDTLVRPSLCIRRLIDLPRQESWDLVVVPGVRLAKVDRGLPHPFREMGLARPTKGFSMSPRRSTERKQKSYKVWQMLVTVFAMAISMRVALGTLPPLEDVQASRTLYYTTHAYNTPAIRTERPRPMTDVKPAIEVLPFNMQGEVPGPLLASILQAYLPQSTANHAEDLRCTLPPGENPRMIVILPEDGEDGLLY